MMVNSSKKIAKILSDINAIHKGKNIVHGLFLVASLPVLDLYLVLPCLILNSLFIIFFLLYHLDIASLLRNK